MISIIRMIMIIMIMTIIMIITIMIMIKKGKETIADQQKHAFTRIAYFQCILSTCLKTLGKKRRSSTFISEAGWSHQVSRLLPPAKYIVFKYAKLQYVVLF